MSQPYQDPTIQIHSNIIAFNYREWFGKDLLNSSDPETVAKELYFAPFAVLSHNDAPDPVFNYANKKAQELWEMDWDKFTSTPSRLSAEPERNPERAKALAKAKITGKVENYEGIRISSTGKRFRIKDARLFNLMDGGRRIGQAAIFEKVEDVE